MASKLFALGVALLLLGCTGSARFPLREPLRRDPDERPMTRVPEEYYSPFAWDAVDQSLFRPAARLFAVDPARTAINVNALDEVPDSSWFTNRLGAKPFSIADVLRGACPEHTLDPNAPDGSWLIDKGKDNGANLGFRISVTGLGKFMLKSDPTPEPERATGATAIASRVYHAVGYFAPCDTVVYVRPSLLRLKPGLQVTNNEGVRRPFDAAELQHLLGQASQRDGLVRMVASAWLPGKPLGPYKYEGVRSDDPNDVVPHEDRRELRGARLLAAWLAHFDSREQNTMDVFLPARQSEPRGPGFVRHYIIDFGDCFGSRWTVDAISRRLNHSYLLDVSYLAEDFASFGLVQRPWERAQAHAVFGYYSARDFDPELWRGEYPNPAFGRMQEADAAWMARILANFDDQLVRELVSVGNYREPDERFLARTLSARRDAILTRYLGKLSPIGRLGATTSGVCGTDLARYAHVLPERTRSFHARAYRGPELVPQIDVQLRSGEAGRVCVDLRISRWGSTSAVTTRAVT